MAVVSQSQNFRPAADPFPGAGRPKFNQLEMVITCTYRSSLVKIDARNLVIVVTDTARPSARGPPVGPPQTGPITIHCAAMLSAQCNHKRNNTYAGNISG